MATFHWFHSRPASRGLPIESLAMGPAHAHYIFVDGRASRGRIAHDASVMLQAW
jgi:hypothetical protein